MTGFRFFLTGFVFGAVISGAAVAWLADYFASKRKTNERLMKLERAIRRSRHADSEDGDL